MDELESLLKIRPHHLLCVLGFRGLGYSEEFISNMQKVVGELSLANSPITLVLGCDAICASCPHSREGKCLKRADSEVEVGISDLELLKRLGFRAGTQMPAGAILERIRERITSEDMAQLCHDCEWWGLGYCAEGLERSKMASQY